MCAIDGAEGSTITIWHETTPRARKPWTCIECGRTIPPGEQYLRVAELYDGRWSTLRTCHHCDAAGEWLRAACGGYLAYGLAEELRDHWDEGYRSILMGKLILGIRDRWHGGADPVPDLGRVRAVAEWSCRKQVAV